MSKDQPDILSRAEAKQAAAKKVSLPGSDGDSEGDGLLLGLAGNVLEDGDGRVDSSSLEEERSDGSARSLGGDEDDVDVGGGNDTGLEVKGRVWVVGKGSVSLDVYVCDI